jgi:hypothetical protein
MFFRIAEALFLRDLACQTGRSQATPFLPGPPIPSKFGLLIFSLPLAGRG